MTRPPDRAAGGQAVPFALVAAFLLALMTSLAAAQIAAGLVIVWAAYHCGLRIADCGLPRRLWILAGGLIGAFALINGLTAGWAGLFEGGRKVWTVLLLPAAAVAAASLDAPSRKWIARLFLGGFSAIALLMIAQFLVVSDMARNGRYGFHSAPYTAGLLLVPLSLLLLARLPGRPALMPWWLLTPLALILIRGRGTLLAWIAATVAALFLQPFARRFRLGIIGLVGVFLAGSLVVQTDRWNLANWGEQFGLQHRFAIWAQAIDGFLDRPLLGHGFDAFVVDADRVAPRYRHLLANIHETNPHNAFLMTLHAAGIAGYAAVWGVYGVVGWLLVGFNSHEKAQKTQDNKLRSVGALPAGRGDAAGEADGDGRIWRTAAAANLAAVFVASFADKTIYVTLTTLATWFLCGWALGMARRPPAPLPRPISE